MLRSLAVSMACLCLWSCTVRRPSAPAEEAAPPPAPLPDLTGKILMAHYMPWYETPEVRGAWGRHWTGHQREHNPDQSGENGLPDIWSHYHPLIGLYDSADPAALECQLLQMKLAGIAGVIVDWYGIGQADDLPSIHQATMAVFEAARRYGMRFAVCYEDRTIELLIQRGQLQPEQVNDHLAQTLQWMQTEWFTRPQYLQYQGGPLLLNFGPMYVREPGPWAAAFEPLSPRPSFYALHHLWRQAGADGGFTWIHFEPWEDPHHEPTILRRIEEVFSYFSKNPDEVIVSAYPGYHDVYAPDSRRLDHRDGKTLQECLQVGMAGPWPLIQLVTWNDYGEGTMIEPTYEFGYTFLEIVQQAKRQEQGEAFAFTPGDLRLPARLYALRKADSVAASELDEIGRLLAEGACQDAEERLSVLDALPSATDGNK